MAMLRSSGSKSGGQEPHGKHVEQEWQPSSKSALREELLEIAHVSTKQDGDSTRGIKSPEYRGDIEPGLKELSLDQKFKLDHQLTQLSMLNGERLKSSLRQRLYHGDTVLPQGTLIHGTRYSDEIIEGIATYGVVSGELLGIVEDSETHYCADFFRVQSDATVADYCQWISEPDPKFRPIKKRRMEGQYLPNPKTRSEQIGVIIDATIPEIRGLLSADAYRHDGDEQLETILGRLPIGEDSPEVGRMAAVLGGVPRGAIAGIVVSPALEENEEHIGYIRKVLGPEIPLLSVDGALIA